jgi:hypothetical protein
LIANANLIIDGTNTYTWDARDHLTAMSGGAFAGPFFWRPTTQLQ